VISDPCTISKQGRGPSAWCLRWPANVGDRELRKDARAATPRAWCSWSMWRSLWVAPVLSSYGLALAAMRTTRMVDNSIVMHVHVHVVHTWIIYLDRLLARLSQLVCCMRIRWVMIHVHVDLLSDLKDLNLGSSFFEDNFYILEHNLVCSWIPWTRVMCVCENI
jgi:hypothetical protein